MLFKNAIFYNIVFFMEFTGSVGRNSVVGMCTFNFIFRLLKFFYIIVYFRAMQNTVDEM